MKFSNCLRGLALTLLISVSTIAHGSDKFSSEKYANYVFCVDAVASAYHADGMDADEAIDKGIAGCNKPFKKYLGELLNHAKRKGGWSRLHDSVKPAVQKHVIENTHELLRPYYLEVRSDAS